MKNTENKEKSSFRNGLFFSVLKIWVFWFLIVSVFQYLVIELTNIENDIISPLDLFLAGIKQHISIASYLTLFTILLSFIQVFSLKVYERLSIVLNTLLLIFLSISNIADALLLNGWGTRVNQQALGYMKFPEEVTTSINIYQLLSLIIGLLACFAVIKILNSVITIKINKQAQSVLKLIMCIPFVFFGARGSFEEIPLMISEPMKFKQERNNQIALSSVWNSIYQLIHINDFPDIQDFKNNRYNYPNYSNKYINNNNGEILINKDSFNSKSNVIILIMEGVGAELSKYYEGKNDWILSNLDSISIDGWAHTQAFASGDRTDKGIVSILAGWPGQPWKGILNYPETFKKMPRLADAFSNLGYRSEFYYGGNSNFMNLGPFVKINGFDYIFDESSIGELTNKSLSKLRKGKWGYNDSALLNFLFNQINKNKKQSLFAVAMLGSTHEPFDILDKPTGDVFVDMKLSVKKVDKYLREFTENLKKAKLWENTLLIITSDHGKFLGDLNTQYGQRNFFHIPLLFTGGALPFKLINLKNPKPVSQCDIFSTLVDLFGLGCDFPKYSRSLVREGHPENAWFNIENVGGLIQSNSTDWLSILPGEIDKERPLNYVDSVILSVQNEIISDFFKLGETFQ